MPRRKLQNPSQAARTPSDEDIAEAVAVAGKVIAGNGWAVSTPRAPSPQQHDKQHWSQSRHGLSRAAVAKALGVSRQAVAQTEIRALEKCRVWAEEHGLALEDLLG